MRIFYTLEYLSFTHRIKYRESMSHLVHRYLNRESHTFDEERDDPAIDL